MRTLPLALALLVACGAEPGPYGPAREVGETVRFVGKVPKNLLMISVDTTRKDHMDAHGSLGLTPFLGSLAESGFVLEDHLTCSNWTYASTQCYTRGSDTVTAGFVPQLTVNGALPVPDGSTTLAGLLGEAGFRSVLATNNAWFSPEWNSSQGYDTVLFPSSPNAVNAYEAAFEALDTLADLDEDRWFLHLHLVEPHAPYKPEAVYLEGLPPVGDLPVDIESRDDHYDLLAVIPTLDPETQADVEQSLRTLYAAEIREMDDRIREVLRRQRERGLLDDTLVVIWNDHGEAFWEHGYQTHGWTLFAEENDGFLFLWADNIVPARWLGPTTSIDLVPTLLELYGLPIPPEVTGLPIGKAPQDRVRYATSVARLGVVQFVVNKGRKLVYSWYGGMRAYDRAADPGEQTDRFDPEDPVIQELWSHLEPYAEATEPLAPTFTRVPPPGLEN